MARKRIRYYGLKKKLKPWRSNAYLYCQLGASGPKTSVHRLICFAFHGDPPAGFEVSHLDGNAKNNRPENLEWASRSANEQQKRLHGTYTLRGCSEKKPWHKKRGTKPTMHPSAEAIILMRKNGASIKEISKYLGMSKSGTANIIKNRIQNASA
jgi:hypothetical protein